VVALEVERVADVRPIDLRRGGSSGVVRRDRAVSSDG
jgi:hypothetical protein